MKTFKGKFCFEMLDGRKFSIRGTLTLIENLIYTQSGLLQKYWVGVRKIIDTTNFKKNEVIHVGKNTFNGEFSIEMRSGEAFHKGTLILIDDCAYGILGEKEKCYGDIRQIKEIIGDKKRIIFSQTPAEAA